MELGSPALQADLLLSEPPGNLQYKIKSSKEEKKKKEGEPLKKISGFGGKVAGDATKIKRQFRRTGLGWKTLARTW